MDSEKFYKPTSTTSTEEETANDWKRAAFLRQTGYEEPMVGTSEATGIVPVRGAPFYDGMKYIKALIAAQDAEDNLEKSRIKSGKPLPSEKEKEILYQKIDQKMAELKYLVDIVMKELQEQTKKIMDMAGGAGDLGLAIAVNLLAKGHHPTSVQIVDPFSKYAGLDVFTDFIIDYLPMKDELRKIVAHTNTSIRESQISFDSVVVAKHPCGDLADEIIEKWMSSPSNLLVIMTCCQDKAHDQPARYGIEQNDWDKWCRESAWTNIVLPSEEDKSYKKMTEKLKAGKEAMDRIDGARVNYLREQVVKVDLVQTDKFPKGNIIIARRD